MKKSKISTSFIETIDMSRPLRITLEQWEALVAVVDAGSYAKAASVLHKSQSSVTYLVQKLQHSLGVKAFEVVGRKAMLTTTGQLLYRRARTLLEDAGGIERVAKQVSAGWEAEITLAADIAFPYRVVLDCFDRFGQESPHTRIELIESVLGGTAEAVMTKRAELAICPTIPPGLAGDALGQLRFFPAAHPDHPLHKLARPLTARDLRAHRQLVIRESDTKRATRPNVEATQRWTVGHMSTSIIAATMGFGWGWYPEERLRTEIAAGTMKRLPLREGGERLAEFYLVFADRENAGPGVLRLAEIIREAGRNCSAEQSATRPAETPSTPAKPLRRPPRDASLRRAPAAK
jgi:DNA-binding transcriptional LysR family regulator